MRICSLTISTPVTISVIGMFHLQARIHFKEIKILVFVHQEFDRARVDIIHCLRGFHSNASHFLAQFIVKKDGRRLFQQFLMTALNGTFTFAQMDHIAM